MKTAATIAQTIIRICFSVMLMLGLLFWTGRTDNLIPLHELLGFGLVLSLWTLAALAALSSVSTRFVVGAALWGLLLPVFGLTQTQILPGNNHWVVQILHLLVGVAAVGQAENLARRIQAGGFTAGSPAGARASS